MMTIPLGRSVLNRQSLPALAGLGVVAIAAVLLVLWSKEQAIAASAASRIEIRLADRSLAEICERIAKAANVHIGVAPEARHWKATIAYRGPVHPLMSAIAENLGLILERRARGASKVERYNLLLPEEVRSRFDLRSQVQARAQREVFARQSQKMVDTVHDLLLRVDQLQDDPTAKQWLGLAPGAKPLLKLLGSLGPEAIESC